MKNKIIFPICNKRPERAPKILGHTFVLCWRCTGVVLGAGGMFLVIKRLAIDFVPVLFVLSIAIMLPMLCDGIMQYGYTLASNNCRRFTTGFLFGLGLTYTIGFIVMDFDSIENHSVLISSVISIIGFFVTFFCIKLELRKSLKEKLVDQQRGIYADCYRKISELVRKPDLIFDKSYYDGFLICASALRLLASNEVIAAFLGLEGIVSEKYLQYMAFCDINDPYNNPNNFEVVFRDETEEPIELYHGTEMDYKIYNSKMSEYIIENTPSRDVIESILNNILNAMRMDIGNSVIN